MLFGVKHSFATVGFWLIFFCITAFSIFFYIFSFTWLVGSHCVLTQFIGWINYLISSESCYHNQEKVPWAPLIHEPISIESNLKKSWHPWDQTNGAWVPCEGIELLTKNLPLLWPLYSFIREGLLPRSRLMGMCHWMGSHFHDWIDYYEVAFL